MAKKNTRVKRNGKKAKKGMAVAATRPLRSAPVRTRGRLDQYGAAWARLLADPCNAPMTSPCYPSIGTGQFIRVHNIFSPMTGANDSLQMTICPGSNQVWYGQTVAGTGGNINAPVTLFNALTNYDSYRCVAACAKIKYVGPESSRRGLVGLGVNPNALFNSGDFMSSEQLLNLCQQVSRTGEQLHEVKWAPAAGDGNFLPANGLLVNKDERSVLTLITSRFGQDAYIEVVAVYEVQYSNTSFLQNNMQPSKSSNSINEVLAALGPPARWAFSHVVAPVIKSVAGVGMEEVRNTANVVANVASYFAAV